jgi:hypothetical protein
MWNYFNLIICAMVNGSSAHPWNSDGSKEGDRLFLLDDLYVL